MAAAGRDGVEDSHGEGGVEDGLVPYDPTQRALDVLRLCTLDQPSAYAPLGGSNRTGGLDQGWGRH